MDLSPNINTREFDKFVEIAGQTVVRVTHAGSSTSSAIKEAILSAYDSSSVNTWADFGTNKERITSIAYTAPSVGAYTVTKTLNYTLIGGKYRYDGDTWSIA